MSDLEITITGPIGSGKTALASWLSHQLQRRAQSGLGAVIIYEDDTPILDAAAAGQRLNAVLRRSTVTIKTIQVSRKAWVAEDEFVEIPPCRDCPACDYSRDEHRSSGRATAPSGAADDCRYTQEDLRL